MGLFIGIDIGTSFCKAVVCRADGTVLYRTTRPNEMRVSGNRAEEDPSQWWENICSMTREIISAEEVDTGAIEGIGISCAGAMMAVDRNGEPLTAAIMQMDKRSLGQMLALRELERRGEICFQNPVTDGVSSLQILMYLRENEPEVYEKCYKFMVPNGYVAQKLTGEFTAEMSRWSTSLLLDMKNRCWDETVCSKLEMDMDKLPRLVSSDEVVGTVSKKASRETGLPQGIKVVAGMLDTASAGLGLGVTKHNDAYMVLGTFGKLCIVVDGESLDDRRFANFTYTGKDSFIKYIAIDGGCGLAVSWFKDCFGAEENAAADISGKSVYALLDEKAAQVSPGSNGLVFLPNLTGGKSPCWDLNAKGVFFGISKTSSKAEFFRAILESIAYSTRMNLELYEQNTGCHIERIKICGGGSKSTVWTQIIADVLNRPLDFVENPDSEACGAAYVATKALEGREDYEWIPAKPVAAVVPRKENVEIYNVYFPVYRQLYYDLEKSYKELYEAQQKLCKMK